MLRVQLQTHQGRYRRGISQSGLKSDIKLPMNQREILKSEVLHDFRALTLSIKSSFNHWILTQFKSTPYAELNGNLGEVAPKL